MQDRVARMWLAFLTMLAVLRQTIAERLAVQDFLLWRLALSAAAITGASTTSTTLANDAISAYIAEKTLMVAESNLRFAQFGEKATIPPGESQTFQFTRYEELALPTATLGEGVTPASTTMSVSRITGTMDQWGQYITLTDLAELTTKHPVLQKGIDLLGLAGAKLTDREIELVLRAGTNVFYPGSITTRATITATDYVSTTLIRKVVATLRGAGARAFDGDNLVGVIDTSVEQDMNADTTFQTASQYSNISALYEGEFKLWIGVRWVRANFLPTLQGKAAATSATSAVAGSLVASTVYYQIVTGVHNTSGREVLIYQEGSQNTGVGGTSFQVTMPSTAGYTYNLYVGSGTGTEKLSSSGNAASAVVTVTAVPSSGAAPPAQPNTSVNVHLTYIIAKEAYVVTELQHLQGYLTPPGAQVGDELAQRRSAGYKLAFKSARTNENYLARIESSSAFPVTGLG